MKVNTNRQRNKRHNIEKAGLEKAASRRSEAGNAGNLSFRQGAISVFILFHLIAIACWAVPWNFSAVRDVRELVHPYMVWSGLFQTWDMFAPNPKSINSYIKTIVITQNHHMKVWTFPRMEELSFGERYRKERYRKFEEALQEQQNEVLRTDVATYVARLFRSQSDPPDKVLLIQFRADITPGGDKSHEPVPVPNILYEGYVDPGDLR